MIVSRRVTIDTEAARRQADTLSRLSEDWSEEDYELLESILDMLDDWAGPSELGS